MHESFSREDKPKGSSDRSFGFVFAAVFALIAVWPVVFGTAGLRWWAAGLSLAFLGAAAAAPTLLAPLNRIWQRLGLALHRIVHPVVMALLFFAVVTPMAFAVRLAGKDLVRRRFDPAAETYWIVRRPPGPAPDTIVNQF